MSDQLNPQDDNADEKYAPHTAGSWNGGKDSESESKNNISDQEKSYGSPSKSESSSNKSASSQELKDGEEQAPDRSRFSAADDINEKLGQGYTGKDSNKSKSLSKMFSSNSAFKKKVAIAGAAAGGSFIVGVVIFIAMLPMKLEHIISNLQTQFGAAATSAVDEQASNLFSSWVAKEILPNLNKGACHSTIDATCVSTSNGDTPVNKLFNGWKDGRLEQKLARMDGGMVIGKQGDRFFIQNTSSGSSVFIPESQLDGLKNGTLSLFDAEFQSEDGTRLTGAGREVTRNQLRSEVRAALRQGTFYNKTFMRFKVDALMERKYGIKRCLIACDTRDKIADSNADRKLAGKAFMYRNMTPQKYGLVMQCVMDPSLCKSDLENATAEDQERQTEFQKKLQAQLVAYKNEFGETKLEELVKKSEAVGKDGLANYYARSMVESIAKKVGGDAAAAAAGDFTTKAIPVVGWVVFLSGVIAAAENLGPALQQATYATNSATAVQMYGTYATAIAEAKSGNGDLTVLGSISDTLSTNLSGVQEDRVDMTQSHLYENLNGSSGVSAGTASIFGSLFSGTVSAQDKGRATAYKCDDGSNVPTGKLVCPEEVLAQGNDAANKVSAFVGGIPVLPSIAGAVNSAVKTVSGPIGEALSAIPGISQVTGWIGDQTSDLFGWATNELVETPINKNMSGARNYDMVAAGTDVLLNKSCQVQLGCAKTTVAKANEIRSRYMAQEQADFAAKPLFARMFDTTSSYSLVSRVAVGMPTNFVSTSNDVATSVITSPVSKLSSVFSNAFSKQTAFASAIDGEDPFGVTQYAISAPKHPLEFWNANCVSGPLATYNASTNKLDVSDWLNKQQADPTTGEAVATTENACLLIQSTVQSVGALFGIPQDEGTQKPASATSGPAAIAGFPLQTTKGDMSSANGDCFDDTKKEMCKDGHPYAAYDVMAKTGTPVVSLFDGEVRGTFRDKCPGQGISIYSPAQGVTVSYLHMSISKNTVKNGDDIKAGQPIGVVGEAAEGCGSAHLHIDAAEGQSRPGCSRERCPTENQAMFVAGDTKIGLGKLLYENFLKLPAGTSVLP